MVLSGKHGEDFRRFVDEWNRRQNQQTPDLHLFMADWLESAWKEKCHRQLLMAFRGSGKSTIAGLFAAWLLYCNPNLRILVLAADAMLAKKMVRQVRKIIERHPLTKGMRPDAPDQWAGERFTVERPLNLRDPSMLARGIDANITGSRADVVICDDVEVPNTCDTAEKREDLRTKLLEIAFVLTPGGTQLYIGTPHNYYTIYADAPRGDIGEEREFLEGFERLEIPVRDKRGHSQWPERFSADYIAHMERMSGPNKFASQMMLRPVNIANGRLDPDLLQIYDHELDFTKELHLLSIGKTKMVGASAWWDPAFGSEKGDSSVFAAVFADGAGNMYLHRIAYIRNEDNKTETDAATFQCAEIARLARDLYLPQVCVESNGIGKFLPQMLRNEIAKAKAGSHVKEITTTRAKDMRILEAFDAVLAAKRLFVHRSVCDTPFIREMREWRPSGRGRDDGLDAVAGALAQHPVRIERLRSKGSQTWQQGAQTHKAKTDFEV